MKTKQAYVNPCCGMKLAHRSDCKGTIHTPTPWKVSIGDTQTIIGPDGQCTAIAHGPQGEWGKVGAEHRANAAFIVRAVNAHEELLAAARAVNQAFSRSPFTDAREDALQRLSDAIAKAEGK